jgi:hypothetical protein
VHVAPITAKQHNQQADGIDLLDDDVLDPASVLPDGDALSEDLN